MSPPTIKEEEEDLEVSVSMMISAVDCVDSVKDDESRIKDLEARIARERRIIDGASRLASIKEKNRALVKERRAR